ncbi:MAG: hypothetical protein AB1847_03705 [bacterium]
MQIIKRMLLPCSIPYSSMLRSAGWLTLTLLLSVTACAQRTISDGPISLRKEIPEVISTEVRYLFYLHGKIIEDRGIRPTDPKFGVYEYEEILDALEEKGFTVISEARKKDTDPEQYAAKIVGQIHSLLDAGAPQICRGISCQFTM